MKHYLVIFSLLMTLSPLSARAGGIPVFDAANLQQTTLSAIEAVNQTLKPSSFSNMKIKSKTA